MNALVEGTGQAAPVEERRGFVLVGSVRVHH